jgi:MFS family permease
LSFPTEFGIATAVDQPGGEADEVNFQSQYQGRPLTKKWKVGAINGAPYIGAALIGCWISDPLNNWFGRRGEIFITSIILILTPIGSGFSQNWYQLFAIRLVLGIGMGAKAATVPMYAAELSPAVVRGALVMGWQLWTAFGIFIGTCANAVVKDVSTFAEL